MLVFDVDVGISGDVGVDGGVVRVGLFHDREDKWREGGREGEGEGRGGRKHPIGGK